MLLLLRAKTVAFAFERFELLLFLHLVVLRPNSSVKLKLEDIVVVVRDASNVRTKDVSWRFEFRGVFNLFAIESCAFPFECVEQVFVIDKLGWIHFHRLLDFGFPLRLLVTNGSVKLDLKERTRQCIAATLLG